MADFPRKDGIQLFYQIRCDKIVWAFGQIVFALFSAVSLAAFALISSTALLSLYFFLIALILLLFALMNSKLAGVLLVGILIVAGTISCAANAKFRWFLPMSHALTVQHFTEYTSAEIFPIGASYLYFIVANLCMVIACAVISKRYQVQ